MYGVGAIANIAHATSRLGEIRGMMTCDLAGGRQLGWPCFVAGTLVSTPAGPRRIEELLSGDRVWGYDLRSGEWRDCPISYHASLAYDDLIVTVRAGGAEVRSTFEHPYWVVAGEELDARPVPAQLGDGDRGTHGRTRCLTEIILRCVPHPWAAISASSSAFSFGRIVS